MILWSSSTEERSFDQDEIAKLNQSKTFDYDRDIPPPKNFLTDLITSIADFLAWFFGNILGYAVLIGLVILLIWIILKNTSLSRLSMNSSKQPDGFLNIDSSDELTALDFDQLISESLNKGDLRSAIRYSFLKALQILELTKRIQWNKEKTNHEYSRELGQSDQRVYGRILNVYEYVWYGEFPPSDEIFSRVSVDVKELEGGDFNE